MWGGHNFLVTASLLCVGYTAVLAEPWQGNHVEPANGNRTEKFLSLFSVVRFGNAVCKGSNSYNGTCMTSAECLKAGGISAGSCASGFGVCCTITISTCQATTDRNCTYWQNPGYASSYSTAGQCQILIQKCSTNICQIRLDLLAFSIAQPNTEGICATDLFTITGSSNNVPTVCGDNAGQHMYLDTTPGVNAIQLAIVATGTTTSRTWNIKISQIPCDVTLTAPDQCLQWYTATAGTIQSFNWAFADVTTSPVRQLSNQDYTICLRMNQAFCGVRYTTCPDTVNTNSAAFTISTPVMTVTGPIPSLVDNNCATDWLQIPCASNQMNNPIQSTGSTPTVCVSRMCGKVFSSTSSASVTAPTTVYSYSKPFELRFHSDGLEASSTPADSHNLGFCLNYVQQPCVTAG